MIGNIRSKTTGIIPWKKPKETSSPAPEISYEDTLFSLIRSYESLLLLERDARTFGENNPSVAQASETAFLTLKRAEYTALLTQYLLQTSRREGQISRIVSGASSIKDKKIDQTSKPNFETYNRSIGYMSRSESIGYMRQILASVFSDFLIQENRLPKLFPHPLNHQMMEVCINFLKGTHSLHLLPSSGRVVISAHLGRDLLDRVLSLLYPPSTVQGQSTPGQYITFHADSHDRVYFQ